MELKYGSIRCEQSLKLYVDDGYNILNESFKPAEDLLPEPNDMNKSVAKFTIDTSKEEILFLDVLVKLHRDLYYSSNIYDLLLYHLNLRTASITFLFGPVHQAIL